MRSKEVASIIGISVKQLNTYLREDMKRYTAKKVRLDGATGSRFAFEIEDQAVCIREIEKRRNEGRNRLRKMVYGLIK